MAMKRILGLLCGLLAGFGQIYGRSLDDYASFSLEETLGSLNEDNQKDLNNLAIVEYLLKSLDIASKYEYSIKKPFYEKQNDLTDLLRRLILLYGETEVNGPDAGTKSDLETKDKLLNNIVILEYLNTTLMNGYADLIQMSVAEKKSKVENHYNLDYIKSALSFDVNIDQIAKNILQANLTTPVAPVDTSVVPVPVVVPVPAEVSVPVEVPAGIGLNLQKLLETGVISVGQTIVDSDGNLLSDADLEKYAKMLNFGTPVGAVIQKIAKDGNKIVSVGASVEPARPVSPVITGGDPKPAPIDRSKESNGGAGGEATGGAGGEISANAQRVIELAGNKLSPQEIAVLSKLNDDQLSVVNRLDATGLMKLNIDGVLKELRNKKLLGTPTLPADDKGRGEATGVAGVLDKDVQDILYSSSDNKLARAFLNNSVIRNGLNKEQQLKVASKSDEDLTRVLLGGVTIKDNPEGILANLKRLKWMKSEEEKKNDHPQLEKIKKDLLSLESRYKSSMQAMNSPFISTRMGYLSNLRLSLNDRINNSFQPVNQSVMDWFNYAVTELDSYIKNPIVTSFMMKHGNKIPFGLKFDEIAQTGSVVSNFSESQDDIDDEESEDDDDWDDEPKNKAKDVPPVFDIELPLWIITPFKQTFENQKLIKK